MDFIAAPPIFVPACCVGRLTTGSVAPAPHMRPVVEEIVMVQE